MARPQYDANGNIVGKTTATQPGTSANVTNVSSQVSAGDDQAETTGVRIFQNDDAALIIYLRLGTGAAVASTGIRLNAAGGSIVLSSYYGPVQAITTAAGPAKLLVTEV